MTTEFETKVVNINKEDVIEKLRRLEALEQQEFLMKRWVFDIESEESEWVRLREEQGKVTITYKYKEIGNKEVGKTKEIEVEVNDFEKTAQILNRVPFKEKFYQENKIHVFILNNIEFSIATWPMLDSYLEIESNSKEKVEEGLKLLDLTGKDVGDKDIKELYKEIGIDIHSYKELKF